MTFFYGEFEHTLDAKHRLTLPARYRSEFAGGVVLALAAETDPGAPRTIMIWRPEAYADFTAKVLAGLNPVSPKARKLRQFLFGKSDRTEPDAANRVMIPAHLRAHAGIDREVTITGGGDYMEIWARESYLAKDDADDGIYGITASLGDTG
ncbi:MAG: division/cell wall cluster transcriptional repressor MraZ [Solirubrobacteraceae bacterium]